MSHWCRTFLNLGSLDQIRRTETSHNVKRIEGGIKEGKQKRKEGGDDGRREWKTRMRNGKSGNKIVERDVGGNGQRRRRPILKI